MSEWVEICARCDGTGDTWEADLHGDYDRCPCLACNGEGTVAMTCEAAAREFGVSP